MLIPLSFGNASVKSYLFRMFFFIAPQYDLIRISHQWDSLSVTVESFSEDVILDHPQILGHFLALLQCVLMDCEMVS